MNRIRLTSPGIRSLSITPLSCLVRIQAYLAPGFQGRTLSHLDSASSYYLDFVTKPEQGQEILGVPQRVCACGRGISLDDSFGDRIALEGGCLALPGLGGERRFCRVPN